ncbi:hypothetical protein BMS3Abin12_02076 [bacterium BMS3Abin12]|nr:hypothetical protein BMS3Abin12_02076 [bacterium BMS3Abin12]
MDQAAVHTTVTILEWVDIDKAKGGCCRLQDRVERFIPHAVIGSQHAGTQCFQIFGAGADEFRQGVVEMIPFTEEDAIRAQPRKDEPRVLDQDTMQANDFFECERVFPGLEYGLAPSFQATAWRTFTFDLETRAAVSQQQETGGAGCKVLAGTTYRFRRTLGQPQRSEGFEPFCSAYDGAPSPLPSRLSRTLWRREISPFPVK